MRFIYLSIIGILWWGCQDAQVDRGLVEPQEEVIRVDTSIHLELLMGKYSPESHPDFVEIPVTYANRKGHFLHKETWDAYQQMADSAARDSISLKIISSTRNFERQKTIWEAKWTGQRLVENGQNLAETTPAGTERALIILKYSSMPSTSRHHWGTDLDINALTNRYFESGNGLREYQWLTQHAASFGFCQPYTPKDSLRPEGYNEEKWHWSYKPLADQYTDQAEIRLKDSMITGFLGAETADSIGVVEKYVLGISQDCR